MRKKKMVDTQDLINRITEKGKHIGQMAGQGDKLSKDIIVYYEMFRRCQEAGSLAFLEDAFTEWMKLHGKDVFVPE